MCLTPSEAPSAFAFPFPSHLPTFDAHCHPTDTMAASMAALPSMRAAVLTVMATRSEDQDLVAQAADKHGFRQTDLSSCWQASSNRYQDGGAADSPGAALVPSFGWHPWFSHHLHDDISPSSTKDASLDSAAFKAAHYAAVLTPEPSPSFVASLPDPIPLSSFIAATRERLAARPHALVGEVGLDKAFRLPQPWGADNDDGSDSGSDRRGNAEEGLTPGGREGRRLSPYRVRMDHQRAVLGAQLALAAEMGRAVSVHGVQAHGVLHDTIAATWKGHERHVVTRREAKRIAPGAEDDCDDSSSSAAEEELQEEDDGNDNVDGRPETKTKRRTKPFPPRVCLHSFSGAPELLQQYLRRSIPASVFVSFSAAVNLGGCGGGDENDEAAAAAKLADVVRLVPDDRLLVESDLHAAGGDMDAALEYMYRRVCEAKGWDVEEGVERIGRNYEEFIFGRRRRRDTQDG